MELKWSLKELYKSFDSEEFKSDLEKVDSLICNLNLWVEKITESKDNSIEKLEEYIDYYTDIENLVNRVGAFIHLTISADTTNTIALKYSDILDDKLTNIVEADTKLNKWISSLDNLDRIIESSDKLKEHKFILTSIVDKAKYLLSDKEENIIANMQNTGSNAWLKLKNNLISNHKVTIEDDGEVKELPLTVVLNMAYDKDKDVRKKAYLAEIESYKKIEDGVAAALNSIKGEVLTICKLRGYESPLEQTLINSRMDKESLDAMLSAMKEAMPTFRKYLRRKAEMLGYKNGLPFYEMYAPVIDKDMEFSYEEGAKFVEKNFRTFSNNLADFAKKAVKNNWIDVYPREGKVGGAFCSNLHFIGESRFLLNYGNTFSDVVTMAHELGHGFHGECLKNESALNSDYPMPIAETASTFCETIIKKAAIKEADKEEALSILESEISDSTQVIVDIYSRFLFESWFFEKRKESALSVDEIKDLMIKAQKEAYGEGLDPEYLHPYMWTWKPHYYYVDSNFYNFPYAFGLLFAKGLYAEYLKRGDSFPKEYENLLSITGKNKIADVTKVMGIDIHNKDFWRSSLKTIEEDIENFIELSK
ncbi:M3 family oligoendopeptidase [Clostridium sp. NSJ-6]|uniref:M3 family oligoendopeptidase n=1 Tax=Clostridium hominis TaxID=2763036 RepID=A0ABR7D8I0_9CLOT|nr:M3 family oligoendopeptidase [Clostridium hominis]MDU2671006.1 M3 family oligoendopeptidase [Clostridium sp.]